MPAPLSPPLASRLAAELLGTSWLVFTGCGAAVLAAVVVTDQDVPVGIGYLGVALAFGLSVTTMAYAVGHVSGGHFNPAVTLGLAVAGRAPWRVVPAYVVVQIVAAALGAGVLYVVASGAPGFDVAVDGFAANGYGDASPGGYSLLAAALVEVVMTFAFVTIILGATDTRAPRGLAPLAIGLALTLIHLVSIPVTNTSVNPARSFGPALFAGGDALSQLWLFVLAPVVGALAAGAVYGRLFQHHDDPTTLQDTASA